MKKGFTIVETLVAIGLFSILIAIAAGGFTRALRTQREAAALISAQSNAGLAIEQIAREARTGYLFCDNPASPIPAPRPPCAPPHCSINGAVWMCDLLDFFNAQGENVQYSLGGGGVLDRSAGGAAQPITSDNVKIDYLKFTIFGNIEGDTWNPRITVNMGVSPNSNDPALVNNVLNLQTSVSARGIDCGPAGC